MLRNAIAALAWCGCLCAQNPVEVHGYLQGRFTDQPGTSDRLEIRRARLLVSGDPASWVSYKVQTDFAKQPYLMDASLTFHFAPSFSLTAGQMKIPFSSESILADNRNQPVSRSRAVLSLSPGRDTGVQGRDTGVQASGVRGRVEYAAGVFRGQTLIYAPKVHYNAAAGRLLVHPARGLTLGADWYGSFGAPGGREKRREELEGEYERGRLTVRAEQIWGRDGTLERRGGYLLGAWRLSRNLEAVARADWLATDIHKANTGSIAYVTGGNLYLGKHVKVGLNAGAERDQGPRGWGRVLIAQVMPYF